MSCKRQFIDRKKVDVEQLYKDYLFGKQTLSQLSAHYGVSISTVRRKLFSKRSTRIISSDKQVIVMMDTTYWGWRFGVVVMKDNRTGKIL